MASELVASASKPRGFLATPSYLRLWLAGGIGNAMRWLELLVAGIFTYEVTQSSVMVALVTVARSLPMLFIGTIAGVVGEALNRKRLLLTQLFVMAVSSSVLCALPRGLQPQTLNQITRPPRRSASPWRNCCWRRPTR
jgi:MFS family permease